MGFTARAAADWTIRIAVLVGFLIPTGPIGLARGQAPTGGARPDLPVRMTVDLEWHPIAGTNGEPVAVDLELSDGRLNEALIGPEESAQPVPPPAERAMPLGKAPSGRVRIRLEAPLSATLSLRFGSRMAAFPLASLIDGPLRTAIPGLVEVDAGRVPWDGLEVRAADPGYDGTAAPGSSLPLLVSTNFLTPEPVDLRVALTGELKSLRTGEVVAKIDRQEFHVASNSPPLPRAFNLPMPRAEGTYALELRATWTPNEPLEGSRIARLWRKRHASEPLTSVRRMTVAVVGPMGTAWEPSPSPIAADTKVDVVDPARAKGNRPVAGGRASRPLSGWAWEIPDAAWVVPGRFDRLRGLLPKVGAEASTLAGADASGLSWTAISLKVPHPGRPHRLAVTLIDGQATSLGVALLAQGTDGHPRLLLDACAATEPVAAGSPPRTLSWMTWPDAVDPVVLLFNRGPNPVRLGAVELTELANGPTPAFPNGPAAEAPREIILDVSAPHALDRFGGAGEDHVGQARNLATYAAHCGASVVVLPPVPSGPPTRDGLDGQAAEDALAAGPRDVMLRILERQGIAAWLDLDLRDPIAAELSASRGTVLVDRLGRGTGEPNPLHPEIREAMSRRVTEAAAIRRARPNVAGLLVRLGPSPTLPGAADTGLDDATFARFVREKLDEATAKNVPGRDDSDPRRFAARAEFVTGPGRAPWLSWRSQQVAAIYADLAKRAATEAPGIALVVATPTLDDGPAGAEARRADVAGLAPDLAWRAVGFDLADWPTGPGMPVVLRGVATRGDGPARDLATSPELDARVVARPDRGLIVSAGLDKPGTAGHESPRLSAPALGIGTEGDELLCHSLAALDARRVVLASSAISGREESVRSFAQAFRALPIAAAPPPPRLASGLGVRTWNRGASTFVALANDTPYPVAIDLTLTIGDGVALEDLGRSAAVEGTSAGPGTRRATVELPPFGVKALMARAPGVIVTGAALRHDEAVKAALEARWRELSSRLTRLGRGAESAVGPPNPGFEPEGPRPSGEVRPVKGTPAVLGWKAAGPGASSVEVDADRPRSGQGSLRLSAASPPSAAVSDAFVPPPGPSLVARFWLRSEPAGAAVRFRLDGEIGGKPLARQAEIVPGATWSEFALRVPDLPETGLDRARLRFELATPGKLWVDDLSLVGPGPSESERLVARRRTILAAVQAYRERRFADFARLANSHWIAPSPTDPDAQEVSARTADAPTTDLSPGRRLR